MLKEKNAYMMMELEEYMGLSNMDTIRDLIKLEFNELKKRYAESSAHIDLMGVPFDHEEVSDAVESLLTTRVTMGKKVRLFENAWAEYINMKECLMVNSGSSANLVALSALTSEEVDNRIAPGSEVITPALTWSTSVFPIINVNARPRLIDVNKEEFIVDVESIKEAITSKTSAIMPVHLLGNPVDMPAIMDLAEDHHLWVIEDCCEAHGAKIGNNKVGSFGHVSTFSFFFSHHITTIEGGAVLTNDESLADIMRSIRAHGWVRERSDREKIIENNPNIDPRFMFVTKGYNLRPTEIQGAFGINQIKKLDLFLNKRHKIVNYWLKELKRFQDYFYLPFQRAGTHHAWFGFPLIAKKDAPFSIEDLAQFLEENNIATRPIMGGNITRHPALSPDDYELQGELTNANYIMDNGIFVSNHQDLREIDQKLLVDTIDLFLKKLKA